MFQPVWKETPGCHLARHHRTIFLIREAFNVSAILIVDDDLEIRELVANVARAAGFQAICAANGQEAISALDASSGYIDLIVTDLTMPIMDGHQLIRLSRKLCPEIRIVCMSGYSDRVPLGVAFLHKPFTVSILSTAIRGYNAA